MNGIIHVVDTVLDSRLLDSEPPVLPPTLPVRENLLQVAINEGHDKFVTAIGDAKLTYLLNRPGPYTVFVPTD